VFFTGRKKCVEAQERQPRTRGDDGIIPKVLRSFMPRNTIFSINYLVDKVFAKKCTVLQRVAATLACKTTPKKVRTIAYLTSCGLRRGALLRI
jgi:hypothetical protein